MKERTQLGDQRGSKPQTVMSQALSNYLLACVLVIVAVAGSVTAQNAAAIPKNWKICKRSDKNINNCMKSAIAGAIKDLAYGNDKLGVPSIEPMHFDSITVDQGAGPVGVRLKFTNLNIHGLSKAVIDKARADYSKYEYQIEFHSEGKVRLQGDYVSSGRVLVIPINGVGKCNLTFDNFKGKITLRGSEVTKNGEKFIRVDKTDILIDTSRLYLNFKRTKQDAISNVLNKFLNDNWKEILDDMKPAISKTFGKNINDIANSVFSKLPLSAIAPP